MTDDIPLDDISFTSHLVERGGRDAVYRAFRSGAVARVARGAYVDAARWRQLAPEARHLVTMRALLARRQRLVFSHRSAALAWGLPLVGAPPALPEVIVAPGATGSSDAGAHLRRTSVPFVVASARGFPVTTVERCLLDVARTADATTSVPMLDHALAKRLTSPARIAVEFARGTHVGARRARYAIDLADADSGSVGESVSRVTLDRIRLPEPQRQVPFRDDRGLIGIVDFWWPELNVIGEFDGAGKYLREEFTRGRTPGEIVLEEKRREDRLRASRTHPRVVRWGWDDALSPSALRAKFR